MQDGRGSRAPTRQLHSLPQKGQRRPGSGNAKIGNAFVATLAQVIVGSRIHPAPYRHPTGSHRPDDRLTKLREFNLAYWHSEAIRREFNAAGKNGGLETLLIEIFYVPNHGSPLDSPAPQKLEEWWLRIEMPADGKGTDVKEGKAAGPNVPISKLSVALRSVCMFTRVLPCRDFARRAVEGSIQFKISRNPDHSTKEGRVRITGKQYSKEVFKLDGKKKLIKNDAGRTVQILDGGFINLGVTTFVGDLECHGAQDLSDSQFSWISEGYASDGRSSPINIPLSHDEGFARKRSSPRSNPSPSQRSPLAVRHEYDQQRSKSFNNLQGLALAEQFGRQRSHSFGDSRRKKASPGNRQNSPLNGGQGFSPSSGYRRRLQRAAVFPAEVDSTPPFAINYLRHGSDPGQPSSVSRILSEAMELVHGSSPEIRPALLSASPDLSLPGLPGLPYPSSSMEDQFFDDCRGSFITGSGCGSASGSVINSDVQLPFAMSIAGEDADEAAFDISTLLERCDCAPQLAMFSSSATPDIIASEAKFKHHIETETSEFATLSSSLPTISMAGHQ